MGVGLVCKNICLVLLLFFLLSTSCLATLFLITEEQRTELISLINNLEQNLNQREIELQNLKESKKLTEEQYLILEQINNNLKKQINNLQNSYNDKEIQYQQLNQDYQKIEKICNDYQKLLKHYQRQNKLLKIGMIIEGIIILF